MPNECLKGKLRGNSAEVIRDKLEKRRSKVKPSEIFLLGISKYVNKGSEKSQSFPKSKKISCIHL